MPAGGSSGLAARAQGRDLRGGTLATAAVQAAGIAAGGLSSFVIALELGAHGTGVFAVASQFLLSLMMLGGVGLRTGIAHEIAAGRLSARAATAQGTVLSLLLGTVAGALGYGLYSLGTETLFEGISRGAALALCAALPLTIVWWVLGAIPLAQADYGPYALLQAAGFVLSASLVVVLAPTAGIDGAVIALACGFALAGLASAGWARARFRGGPESWDVARSLAVGLRGWPLEMLQFLVLRPDVVIVAAFGSTADAGVYSMAVTITTIGWVLPQAVGTLALPRTAALVARPGSSGSEAIDAARRTLRGAVPLALGAAVVVGALLLLAPLVFGSSFDRTPGLGAIMLPGVVALALGRIAIALLLGLGRGGAVLAIGMTVVPAALAAYLLSVPSGGPEAAAAVSCAAYLATSAAALAVFLRETRTQ
jgi:O-antigen/teichoic acid export membrane protein